MQMASAGSRASGVALASATASGMDDESPLTDRYYWLRPETHSNPDVTEHHGAAPMSASETTSQTASQQREEQPHQYTELEARNAEAVDQRTGKTIVESAMQTNVYFLERQGESSGVMHPAACKTPLFVDKETGRITAGVPIKPNMSIKHGGHYHHPVTPASSVMASSSAVHPSVGSASRKVADLDALAATAGELGDSHQSDGDSFDSALSVDEECRVLSSLSSRRRGAR